MAAAYIEKAKHVVAELDGRLNKIPALVELEHKTKVPKVYFAAGKTLLDSLL